MSNGSSNNSSVTIVAIVAVLILAGGAAWFAWGRPGGSAAPARTPTSQPADTDIHVKVDLPDSVNIQP